jgi:predicted HNH restriction endonuclease
MPIKDPEQRRAYQRQYMAKYYDEHKSTQIERNRERRRKNRDWLRDYKSSLKCEVCGEDHIACLDFHHRDPQEKETSLFRVIWVKCWGKERILAEIAKCQVLCSNCHRKLHWRERVEAED